MLFFNKKTTDFNFESVATDSLCNVILGNFTQTIILAIPMCNVPSSIQLRPYLVRCISLALFKVSSLCRTIYRVWYLSRIDYTTPHHITSHHTTPHHTTPIEQARLLQNVNYYTRNKLQTTTRYWIYVNTIQE